MWFSLVFTVLLNQKRINIKDLKIYTVCHFWQLFLIKHSWVILQVCQRFNCCRSQRLRSYLKRPCITGSACDAIETSVHHSMCGPCYPLKVISSEGFSRGGWNPVKVIWVWGGGVQGWEEQCDGTTFVLFSGGVGGEEGSQTPFLWCSFFGLD